MNWFSKLSAAFRGYRNRTAPEAEFEVHSDEDGVWLTHPRRDTERVGWADLQEVEIVRTDDGPWGCDWYWVLHGTESGVAVPRGARGEAALLGRLQRLPGFDNAAVMTETPKAGCERATCWRRGKAPVA